MQKFAAISIPFLCFRPKRNWPYWFDVIRSHEQLSHDLVSLHSVSRDCFFLRFPSIYFINIRETGINVFPIVQNIF